MGLSLVSRVRDNKRVIDLSLSPDQIKIGSIYEARIFKKGKGVIAEIMANSDVLHLDQGQDSDVYKVGREVVKVYCSSGSIERGREVPCFETLKRYAKLTADAKKLLENSPPEDFTSFQGKDTLFDVKYKVVLVGKRFQDIGENLRKSIINYFGDYVRGYRIRWVFKGCGSIAASVQPYIDGESAEYDNSLRKKGISKKELGKFIKGLWDTFPDYNLLHFGEDMRNIKVDVNKSSLKITITDLSAKIWQQVNYFERGKRYSNKEILKLLEEEKKVI